MADKDILELVQSSKNIIETDSDSEKGLNNATPVPTSSGIKNIWKDSDENMRLNESDCEEFVESADEIDNIPVYPDIYATRDVTEWILPNINPSSRFSFRNVLGQSIDPRSFAKHNLNVSFLGTKGHNT
ncbi:hypothetical protein TNCV_3476781 [Trichonephila clavipes]|nr:hypothetical protein TNCV_3476781 [Trichonephila clavipes]